MLALLLAVLLDLTLGEPPAAVHPVVWMGKYLSWLKPDRARRPVVAFLQGLAGLVFGLLLFTAIVWMLNRSLRLAGWLRPLLLALLLKPMFSIRALLRAGREVRDALLEADLSEARRLVGWHLVSRDTAALEAPEVAAAAISSLAENLTDSVVAPLVYFALFGLVGAVLYRFINTADAVLGYRTEALEFFGKTAARLDDSLNYLPARLTLLLLLLAMPGKWQRALQVVRTDAGLTPSPNGGLTMAAVAGGLDVRLDKRGVYSLNAGGRAAGPSDLEQAEQLVLRVTMLTVLFALLGLVWQTLASALSGLGYAAG